jgi:hypothetical protein
MKVDEQGQALVLLKLGWDEQRAGRELLPAPRRSRLRQPGMGAGVFDHRRRILRLLQETGEQKNDKLHARIKYDSCEAGHG